MLKMYLRSFMSDQSPKQIHKSAACGIKGKQGKNLRMKFAEQL